MRYRARLVGATVLGRLPASWTTSAFFHTQNAPPNANFQCLVAGGTVGGGTFPCLISNYNNIEPSYYTFDLSIGYDTGVIPRILI